MAKTTHQGKTAADVTDVLRIHFEQVHSLEESFTGNDLARRTGYQAHAGKHGYAFSATAFTHHAQGFPFGQVERDTIYCMNYPLGSFELSFQTLHF